MDKVDLTTIRHYKLNMDTGEKTLIKTELVVDDGKKSRGLAALFE